MKNADTRHLSLEPTDVREDLIYYLKVRIASLGVPGGTKAAQAARLATAAELSKMLHGLTGSTSLDITLDEIEEYRMPKRLDAPPSDRDIRAWFYNELAPRFLSTLNRIKTAYPPIPGWALIKAAVQVWAVGGDLWAGEEWQQEVKNMRHF
jgi:hypothetical protein